MRNFKKILALLLSITMVLGLGVAAFATSEVNPGDGGTPTGGDAPAAETQSYTITVDNTSNQNVSIKDKEYTAYKLFDASYSTPDEAAAEYSGNIVDDAAHSYYMSTTSPFYTGTSYNAETKTWTYGTYTAIVKDYFDFTVLPGDASKVLVTPKEGTEFTEEKAYEMAQKLESLLSDITGTTYKFNGTGTSDEVATIDVTAGGAGYYLVTGTGKSADGKDVTAAVALTTTDPTATIKAKVTGTTLDKSIDEGTTGGKKDDGDVKEDNHSVGDIIPYVITTAVPDMTGYEKFYYIVRDTMSKGLTFNDDVKVVITYPASDDANGKTYVEHLTSTETGSGATATYNVTNEGTHGKKSDGTYVLKAELPAGNPDDYATEYVVRNHEFVLYTDITTLEFVKDGSDYVKSVEVPSTATSNDYSVTLNPSTGETFELIFKDFFNKANGLTGANITITYSATLNDEAVISDENTLNANENKANLEYSNNPNVHPKPGENKDKPSDDTVTGKTPDSTTKTYTTGIDLFKYAESETKTDADMQALIGEGKTYANEDAAIAAGWVKKTEGSTTTWVKKSPLAGAKFTLTGTALNKVVETTKNVFVEDASGTYYLLTDGTYTTTSPTSIDTAATNYDELIAKYVDRTGATKYKTTTLTSYAYEPEYTTSDSGSYVKKTVGGTDTYEDYNEGTTYTEAAGYTMKDATNVQRYTREISYTVETDENGKITFTGLNEGTYTLTEIEAPDGYNVLSSPINIVITANYSGDPKAFTGFTATKDGVTLDGNLAELFDFEVLNSTGTELPSTGGIGTTIFYIVGGLLAVGAGVVLVSKKRMGKVDD